MKRAQRWMRGGVGWGLLGLLAGCRSPEPPDEPLGRTQAAAQFVVAQKLTASDAASGDNFGRSVGLSADGNTALVGAYLKTNGGLPVSGAAYVLVRSNGTWSQQQKLSPSDAASGDRFGNAVALSADGNTALVGAYAKQSGSAPFGGVAYVLVRSNGTWTQQQKLTASDAASGDQFGDAVALSGDGNTALISAYGKANGGLTGSGAAYVLVRNNGTWSQQQKLSPSDAASGDQFGYSVALSADGNTALVGACLKNGGQPASGVVYALVRSNGSWTQQQRLQPADVANVDQFGDAVALSADGNTTLIGAYGKSDGGLLQSGAAYVLVRSNGVWTQQQKLTASDVAANEKFGFSVALSADGTTAAVGVPFKSGNQGATHVFLRSGGSWAQSAELLSPSPTNAGYFGISLALSADASSGLVGADGEPSGALANTGVAYALQPLESNGEACSTNGQCASGFCVDGVCCNQACGNGADDCQACSVAAGAKVDGTCAPLANGSVCRAAAGDCDEAEVCNGSSGACPADAKKAKGAECRASAGECDAAESCDGSAGECPADGAVADGSECSAGVCAQGVCSGAAGGAGAGGEAGSAGSAGAAGEAGAGGDSGSAGEAGAAGESGAGGQAGQSGSAGDGGDGGSAGAAGSAGSDAGQGGQGGSAGQGGSGASGASGQSGSAGQGGASGKGGQGGKAGSGASAQAGSGGSAQAGKASSAGASAGSAQAGGAGKAGAAGAAGGSQAEAEGDGGCGCTAAGASSSAQAWSALLLAAGAAVRRRRSRGAPRVRARFLPRVL